jgi:hypothetical protein
MKRSSGLILLSFLTVAVAFAGCSDDPPKENNPTFPPQGGSSGAAAAGTPGMAGTQSASGDGGTFSTAGTDTGGTAGSGGETGGTAGTGGAAAGSAGTAGTGGTPPVVMVDLLVDSVVVRKVGSTFGDDMGGEGGAGGAGGEGNGAGGAADPGAGGVGAGGEGAAPRPEVALSFFFDADLELWDLQSYGSTPNVGIDGGPEKLSRLSMQTWVATGGYASPGAMNVKVPFSTKDEQLDIHRALMPLDNPYKDYSGYEIVAKVKLVSGGAVGECLGAWIYVTTGNMYRFARGNLAAPLVVDDWAELEFELDDPDPNSTPDGVHPEYDPTEVGQLGIHIQSRACAP